VILVVREIFYGLVYECFYSSPLVLEFYVVLVYKLSTSSIPLLLRKHEQLWNNLGKKIKLINSDILVI